MPGEVAGRMPALGLAIAPLALLILVLAQIGGRPRRDRIDALEPAPEIDVRDPRRTGEFMISLATASAVSGPSITRQGIMIFWSLDADHSK